MKALNISRAADRLSARRLFLAYALTAAAVIGQGLVFLLVWWLLQISFVPGAGENSWFGDVWWVASALVGTLIMVVALSRYAQTMRLHGAEHVVSSVSQRLMRKSTDLPLGWFNVENQKRLTQLLNDGIPGTKIGLDMMAYVVIRAYTSVLTGVIISYFLVGLSFAMSILIAALGTTAVAFAAQPALRKNDTAAVKAESRASDQLVEYVQAHPVYRAFASTRSAAHAVLDAFTTLDRYERRGTALRIVYTVVVPEVLFAGALLAILFFGIFSQVSVWSITVGVILAIWALEPLTPIGRAQPSLVKTLDVLGEVHGILSEPTLPEPQQPKNVGEYSIGFDQVEFAYDGAAILDGVSFTIANGTTTALVGPSGAGKTTLLRLVARFWDVRAGTVTIGGKDLRDIGSQGVLAETAIVFQNVQLLQGTIRDNLLIAKPDATQEELDRVAQATNLVEVVASLPQGWQTQVGERGVRLSGGQQQRVAIARAMLKDAPIVLLDEATSSLDSDNERAVLQGIQRLGQGRTVLMITHRLSSAKEADQIIFLEDGKIVEAGNHAELIRKRGRYYTFWNTQMQGS